MEIICVNDALKTMRHRYHASLEEGIVYRDPELPAPATLPRIPSPTPRRQQRDVRVLAVRACACVCVLVAWYTLASVLSRDSSSPCSTVAHSFASWGLPRFLSALFPRVVSVRDERLWWPVVLAREGQLLSKEVAPGCTHKSVMRASKIVVRSNTWFGRRNSTFSGVAAACIQHALDFAHKGCARV